MKPLRRAWKRGHWSFTVRYAPAWKQFGPTVTTPASGEIQAAPFTLYASGDIGNGSAVQEASRAAPVHRHQPDQHRYRQRQHHRSGQHLRQRLLIDRPAIDHFDHSWPGTRGQAEALPESAIVLDK